MLCSGSLCWVSFFLHRITHPHPLTLKSHQNEPPSSRCYLALTKQEENFPMFVWACRETFTKIDIKKHGDGKKQKKEEKKETNNKILIILLRIEMECLRRCWELTRWIWISHFSLWAAAAVFAEAWGRPLINISTIKLYLHGRRIVMSTEN